MDPACFSEQLVRGAGLDYEISQCACGATMTYPERRFALFDWLDSRGNWSIEFSQVKFQELCAQLSRSNRYKSLMPNSELKFSQVSSRLTWGGLTEQTLTNWEKKKCAYESEE